MSHRRLSDDEWLKLLEDENFPPTDFNCQEFSEDEDESDEENSTFSEHDSNSENDLSDGDDNLENEVENNHLFMGKDGKTKWNSFPKPTSRTRAKNIVLHLPGPKRAAKSVVKPQDTFSLFFDGDMVDKIVKYTNIKIESVLENRVNLCSYERRTNREEIYAVFGLLFICGVMRSSHLQLHDLWNTSYGPAICHAAMSNKLAAIVDLWEAFIVNCQKHYIMSEYVTIDEILCPFRGRCCFVQYLPNKPAKYGIKIFGMNCARTFYFYSGKIYAGKENKKRAKNLAHDVVMNLTVPIHNTARNITTDNWYTSIPLGKSLLQKKLTLVGTLKKNKVEIPKEFQANKQRAVYSTLEGFSELGKMVSYVPKKGKCVIIFSTMHDDRSKLEAENKNKPEEIEFYNKSKGGIDTLDKLCATYTTQRGSRRWPMVIFYFMLNACTINGQVIFRDVKPDYFRDTSHSRRLFIREIGEGLVRAQLQIRSGIPNLQPLVKLSLARCGFEVPPRQEQNLDQPGPPAKRKRCALCSRQDDKKTNLYCSKCKTAICKNHSYIICSNCHK
nr:uncharacterized protein LOC111417296 [Onthophagus taurus]